MDGRDTQGKFTEGYSGGPGRLTAEREAEYLETMRRAVSIEDWKKIIRQAVTDAEDGDPRARDWLGQYLCPGVSAALPGPDEHPRLSPEFLRRLYPHGTPLAGDDTTGEEGDNGR